MHNKNYIICFIIIISIILINCNGNSYQNKIPDNPPIMPITADKLSISKSTIFPISNNSGAEYYLKFTNDSDRELNLVNSQLNTINKIKSKEYNNIINTSYCNKVNAKQSCYIIINPPSIAGSLVLNLNYKDKYDQEYQISTLITYADIPGKNGFKINSDLITVNTNKLSNIVAIPFQLEDNFTNISVNTNMPIYNTEIKCNNSSYIAGTYCTAFINVKPGDLISNLNIIGTTNPQNIHRIVVPLEITQNIAANLITNTNAVIIKSPEIAQLIIFNNGNAPATLITLNTSTESNINIVQNNCSTLNVESSCTIKLAYSGYFNNSTTISISYQGGLKSTTSLPVNIAYYTSNPAPGLITTISNNFIGTKINESRATVVELTNTSTDTTVIKLESVTRLPTRFVFDSSIITKTSCFNKTSLMVGESCQYGIRYNAPSTAESGNINYFVKGSYNSNESSGSVRTIVSTIAIGYSSLINGAILNISPSSGTIFSIKADGQTKQTQTFIVNNTAGDGPALNITLDNLPTNFIKESTSTCANNLAVGESCTYVITFGPITTNIANTLESLRVKYFKYTNSQTQTTAFSNFSYNASIAALIITESFKVLTPPIYGLNGLGTTESPYQFTSVIGNNLVISSKYTNIGNDSALKFNIATNTLPIGYYIESRTTCPNGSQTRTLLPNESCILAIGLVDPQFMVKDFYLPPIASTLNVLGYSYQDTNSGINIFDTDTSKRLYINVNKWGNLIINNPSINQQQISLSFNIYNFDTTVTSDSSYTITADISNISGLTGSSTCTANTINNTCVMVLSYDPGLPLGTYYIPITAQANGSAVTTIPLKGTVTFTLQ
jgi:hypothetical protein